MGKRDEIEEAINKIIGECFMTKAWDEGRKRLYKLFLSVYYSLELNLEDMRVKRNLLYRLIYAEKMSKEGTEAGVKNYVLQLKRDMDNTLGYKERYTREYLDMLSYYFDCSEIKTTKEEEIEYYDFAYEYYKDMYEMDKQDISYYIRMINMKFNKNIKIKNFKNILYIIKDLHNINDKTAQSTMEQMLCDIKVEDKQVYNEALELIKITSKLCV